MLTRWELLPKFDMYFVLSFLSKAESLPDGKIYCTLRVHWGEFVGKGANFRIAKATAAKFAMEALNENMPR